VPGRFTGEPMPVGPNKGTVFPFEELRPLYYKLRGWDEETGFPQDDVLADYGLEDLVDELAPYRQDYLEKISGKL